MYVPDSRSVASVVGRSIIRNRSKGPNMTTTHKAPDLPVVLRQPTQGRSRRGLDFLADTGDLIRCHSGSSWPAIPAAGPSIDSAEVFVSTEEMLLEGVTQPSTVTIVAEGQTLLTPEQARVFARYVLEAADAAERENEAGSQR
jgi:hypothetical protein